jgi:hypothetical protein
LESGIVGCSRGPKILEAGRICGGDEGQHRAKQNHFTHHVSPTFVRGMIAPPSRGNMGAGGGVGARLSDLRLRYHCANPRIMWSYTKISLLIIVGVAIGFCLGVAALFIPGLIFGNHQ